MVLMISGSVSYTHLDVYKRQLYIPGYGYGRVEDTGSNKHDAGTYCLDLFMETKQECKTWGVKRNVKIYILK